MKSDVAHEVLRDLGRDPQAISLDEAEDVLRERVVALHPDMTRATEASPEYHQAKQALDAVRKEKLESALVPVEQARALAELATKIARDLQPTRPQLPTRQEVVAQVREGVKDAQSGAKIASGTAFAVATALFAILGQGDHPIVVLIQKTPGGMQGLIGAWGLSAALFLTLKWREKQSEVAASYLLSDHGLRETIGR